MCGSRPRDRGSRAMSRGEGGRTREDVGRARDIDADEAVEDDGVGDVMVVAVDADPRRRRVERIVVSCTRVRV